MKICFLCGKKTNKGRFAHPYVWNCNPCYFGWFGKAGRKGLAEFKI